MRTSSKLSLVHVGVIALATMAAGSFSCAAQSGDSGGDGGASSAGNGGPGSSTASSSTATSGPSSSSSTSGVTSSSAGTGGSGGAIACAGVVPAGAPITDFTTLDTSKEPLGTWGPIANDTFWGGLYAYGGGVTGKSASAEFEISGNVATYSGFGLWFANCADASAFTGVSFHVEGNVGASGMITLQVMTNSDYPITPMEKKGGCAYTSEQNKYVDCVEPSVAVPIPAGGGTVSVSWSDLAGGKPVGTVNPKEIVGLQWAFAWADAMTPYDVDVVLDDVAFVGGSGSGGAGGN